MPVEPLYARFGVPEYWVMDLNTNQLVCYSNPVDGAYRTLRHHRLGESVTPVQLSGCEIAVNDLIVP